MSLPFIKMAGSIYVCGVLTSSSINMAKDLGPNNFNLFIHQWPTKTAEAAAQEPLIEWIRDSKWSHQDFVTGHYPVKQVQDALKNTVKPNAIKTLFKLLAMSNISIYSEFRGGIQA